MSGAHAGEAPPAKGPGTSGGRSAGEATRAKGPARRSPIARLRRRMAAIDLSKLLRASAMLTLLALALMVWSMVQPTPLPVMLAMTVGQGLGTLAFATYGYVVIADLRRIRRARRAGDPESKP
jgi:hypothetical protein